MSPKTKTKKQKQNCTALLDDARTYQVSAVSRLDRDGGLLLLLLLLLPLHLPGWLRRLAGEADHLGGGVRGGDSGLGGRRGGECHGHGVLALLVLRLPDLVRRRREGERLLRPQLARQPPLALRLLRAQGTDSSAIAMDGRYRSDLQRVAR